MVTIVYDNIKSKNWWDVNPLTKTKTEVQSNYGKVALRFVDSNGKAILPAMSIVPTGNYETDTYEIDKPTSKITDLTARNLATAKDNKVTKKETKTEKTSKDVVTFTKASVPNVILSEDGNYYIFDKFSESNKSYKENSQEYKSDIEKGKLEKDRTLNVVSIYKKADYGKVVIKYVKETNNEELQNKTTTT